MYKVAEMESQMIMSDLLMGQAHLRDNSWELLGNGGAVLQASYVVENHLWQLEQRRVQLDVAAEFQDEKNAGTGTIISIIICQNKVK